MARLSFRCDEELVQRVDEARGRVARERWLRDAVETMLSWPPSEETIRAVGPALDALGPDATARDAADAITGALTKPYQSQPGPNVENVRSSSQSKRDVRPRPKGGKT